MERHRAGKGNSQGRFRGGKAGIEGNHGKRTYNNNGQQGLLSLPGLTSRPPWSGQGQVMSWPSPTEGYSSLGAPPSHR